MRQRPWGNYVVVWETETHKIKNITVNPNSRLSYQRHKYRAEHWYIVEGVATVTIDGVTSEKVAGQTVDVGIGQLHRIGNATDRPVVFVEVQTGSYFGEDDIERLEDDYEREGQELL